MAIDRNALRQGVGGATKDAAARTNEGPGFKTYLKAGPRPRYGKIPEGTLVLDIIPFAMESDFNEHYKKGGVYYTVDVWVHRNVGPTGDVVLCPAATFGKPCPICEERENRARNGEDNETRIKPIRATRRSLYNIWVHDPSHVEQNKGVQIFEIAHYSFEAELLTISRDPLTQEFTFFADPDNGKVICFDRKGTGAKNTRYSGFRFLDRKAPIPDAILEQAVSLEKLITVLPYADIAAKFYGEEQEQSANDNAAASSPHPAIAEEGDDYDYTATATNAATNDLGPASPSEDDLGPAESPAEQSAPTVAPTKTPRQPLKSRPAPAGTSETATPPPATINKCPVAEYGGNFGVTTDKFPQCATCQLWDDCTAVFDEIPF